MKTLPGSYIVSKFFCKALSTTYLITPPLVDSRSPNIGHNEMRLFTQKTPQNICEYLVGLPFGWTFLSLKRSPYIVVSIEQCDLTYNILCGRKLISVSLLRRGRLWIRQRKPHVVNKQVASSYKALQRLTVLQPIDRSIWIS